MKRGSAQGAPSFKCLKSKLFLDLSSLTHAVTQIVQLSPADLTSTDGLDLLDHRAVEGEDLLHADAVRDAADGEGLCGYRSCKLGNDGCPRTPGIMLTAASPDAQVTRTVSPTLTAGQPGMFFSIKFHKIHSLSFFSRYTGVRDSHSQRPLLPAPQRPPFYNRPKYLAARPTARKSANFTSFCSFFITRSQLSERLQTPAASFTASRRHALLL